MAYLEELLPEFRKGAKIRLNAWKKDEYIFLKDNIVFNQEMKRTDRLSIQILKDSDWELYKEPEPDWGYIIKNKCLCWFYDDEEENKRVAGLLADYDSYNSQFGIYKGKNIAVTYYDYCRPVHKDEVIFYEDKNDK